MFESIDYGWISGYMSLCAHLDFKAPFSRSCKANSSVFRSLYPSVTGSTQAHVYMYVCVRARLIVS
jgi:hypothetical protein